MDPTSVLCSVSSRGRPSRVQRGETLNLGVGYSSIWGWGEKGTQPAVRGAAALGWVSSGLRMLEGSGESPGKRILTLPRVGILRRPLWVGTRWASVIAGGGRSNADSGVDCGFPGCLQGQNGCAGLLPQSREQVRPQDSPLPQQLP